VGIQLPEGWVVSLKECVFLEWVVSLQEWVFLEEWIVSLPGERVVLLEDYKVLFLPQLSFSVKIG
jgi:hypothetical protein